FERRDMIRVLVVDDHPIVRQGLVSVLGDEEDLEVVGEARSGREAIALTPRLQPDVVLLDLEMPDVDGVEAIPLLLAARPGVEVLRLVAEGLPTKQIALSLSISERTVKFHVNSIFHKLGADNRAQAVALAAQRGLL